MTGPRRARSRGYPRPDASEEHLDAAQDQTSAPPDGGRAKTPRGTAGDRALGLLAVRWRSRRELERRLRQAGFPSDEIEEALIGLERAGLVDDERFARELVRSHATARLSGSRAIRGALRQSGVSEDVAEQALAEGAPDEEGRAAALAAKRLARMTGLAPEAAARRLYGLLVRRGYGPDVARDVSRRALDEATDLTVPEE